MSRCEKINNPNHWKKKDEAGGLEVFEWFEILYYIEKVEKVSGSSCDEQLAHLGPVRPAYRFAIRHKFLIKESDTGDLFFSFLLPLPTRTKKIDSVIGCTRHKNHISLMQERGGKTQDAGNRLWATEWRPQLLAYFFVLALDCRR